MRTVVNVILLLSVWFFAGCNRKTYVTVDKTDGYKGAAKLNPYLAAQTFLREVDDLEVRSKSGFVRFDYETGMVISPASTLSTDIMVDKMLRWVTEGGVYVCLLERGEKHWEDVGEACDHDTYNWRNDWYNDEENDEALEYLLDRMSIELVDDPSGKTTGGTDYYGDPKNPVVLGKELPLVEERKVKTPEGETLDVLLGGTRVMKYSGNLRFNNHIHDEGKYHRFLGLSYGDGRIYFISDGRIFRNPYLGMKDHAELLERMSDEVYFGDIIFAFGEERGFWSLMISYAGPALLGVFVLLVFWLWKSIPRFGPLLEIPEGHARFYAQSVLNTGRFLWKYKSADVLLNSLRQNLLKTSGMFHADGQVKESLIESFAEKSGLGVEEVIEALTRNNINEAGDMVRITRNLQTIQKSL